ncbi:MAG: GNAT family N-acetyltransferase [Defluviitaleaceae bacterium]|nr:GNAT family N-acetyltransferase [Defluviitaleaceae bacterium]
MINTERLILRRFTVQDEQEYADIWASPNFYRYLGTGTGIPKESIGRMIDMHESSWGYGLGTYAVIEQASGKLIGHCGVRGLPCGRKEILYAYSEDAWGKGYATEAARAVLAAHDARPLIAVSYPENPGSIAVLKKVGFRHVGQEKMFGKALESFILD